MTRAQDVNRRETIPLRVFVEALRADFEADARAREVTLDALVFVDRLEGDASLLRRLLIGLSADALRRAPRGTSVSLVVSPSAEYTQFRFADEGSPVLREQDSKLPFYRAAAETNGGQLSVVESESGTVVCLAFPSTSTSAVEVDTYRAPSESGTYPLAAFAAPQTVLVVDDEPMIRSFLRRVLKDKGYSVVEADSAEKALEILKAQQQTISLLLTDVGLPGASGAELVRQVRLLVPGLPTLLMSASHPALLAQRGVLETDTYLLRKPFDLSVLLAKIEEGLSLARDTERRVTA